MTILAIRKSVKGPTKEKIARTDIIGKQRGIIIFHRIVQRLAPSMRAASSDFGIVSMYPSTRYYMVSPAR